MGGDIVSTGKEMVKLGPITHALSRGVAYCNLDRETTPRLRLQYHNHPHSLPDISNRFMVRFCFNETKI